MESTCSGRPMSVCTHNSCRRCCAAEGLPGSLVRKSWRGRQYLFRCLKTDAQARSGHRQQPIRVDGLQPVSTGRDTLWKLGEVAITVL